MICACIRKCSAGRLYRFGDVANLEAPNRHFIPVKGELPAAAEGALLIARTQDPAELRQASKRISFTGLYRTKARQFFTITGEEGGQAKCKELNEAEAEKAYGKLPVSIPHPAAFCPLRAPGETGYVRWKK
jgi:hypothetical protein